MNPTVWRKSEKLTLSDLSREIGNGRATGYLSETESGKRKASGAVLTAYHDLSKGKVTPDDFKKVRREYMRRRTKNKP